MRKGAGKQWALRNLDSAAAAAAAAAIMAS
jgi:hypothetical protein